eukprot:c13445_g1_i1.p1 GENE.c13445_g1_i1~~c13445_g1_i1.p1  ORF type:complete len:267 (+),score=51.41 c13445_g1_i1:71-802(+)
MRAFVEREGYAARVANMESSRSGFFLDDLCLIRYLEAREGDVDKAQEMLRKTIEWRESKGIGRYLEDPSILEIVRNESSTAKVYVPPYRSKLGHGVLIMVPANEKSRNHETNMINLVYQLERACAAALKPMDKIVLLVWYKGYSLFNAPPIKTTLEALHTIQDHFPQRLFRAYAIDAPFLFVSTFNLISPFMTQTTREKVCFVSSNTADFTNQLSELFDMNDIPSFLGGTSSWVFNVDEYMRQ